MSSLFDVHRWRRMSWPRLVVYIVCALLLLLLCRSFYTIPSTPILSDALDISLDFPWYQSTGHPSLLSLQDKKYTTTHLSTTERAKLEKDAVTRTKLRVKTEFSKIKGIPGSVFRDDKTASTRFRALVDCWTTGEWVQVTSVQNVMPHFQDPLYGSCDRKYKKQHPLGGQRDAIKYVWKSKCDIQQVDSGKWCEALHGRHLLLVGDLVQYQLHELFLDTLRDGPAVCFGELNCKDHTVCTEPYRETRLRYLRNDILSVRRKMDSNHGHPKADVIEWPFTSNSLMRGYPIVILNRAPVIESDNSFMEGLIETLHVMRKANPNALLLYRSTGIGHPFCNDATEPLTEPLKDEALKRLPFGWSELSRRNAMARVVIEAAGGVFVDLAALSDLRPDGHIGGQDCLRYCIPGPLDSWARILYQVFLGLEGRLEDSLSK